MLKEYIYKRKSTRKYDMTPLSDDILNDIKYFAKTITPLYKNIRTEYSFANAQDVKNLLPVKAPHYIIISSENTDGYLTNVGFLFQQMDLYVSSLGLGSCWLGLAKPTEKGKLNTSLEFVIILAFGNSIDTPYREVTDFKRKPLSQIANTADERLEVARLAPSGINAQPWCFVQDGDTIHVYCVKSRMLKAVVYQRLNMIDIGIALAHLYVTNSTNFSFAVEQNPQKLKGYSYIGSVKIN